MPARSWRSLLYVPADNQRYVSKAHERGADAIILDLEDGVAPERKEEARAGLADSVAEVRLGGAFVIVRVNRPWHLAWKDVEAAVVANADGILFPKVETAHQLSVLVEYLAELESLHGASRLAVLICLETAAGVANARDIIDATGRVDAVIPGIEDLAASFRVEPDRDQMATIFAPALAAARAAGAAPIGTLGSSTNYKDLEGFQQLVKFSMGWGFEGVTCVHPAQVTVVNELFRRSQDSLDAASRIVEAFEAGSGEPVSLDGQMVDRPVYVRAKRLLRRKIVP